MTAPTRPTLLSSCARAATAAEARYRIDGAPRSPRSIRVVALDPGAAEVVHSLDGQPWRGTRFLTYHGDAGGVADIVLSTPAGSSVRLSDELLDADFLMMLATADGGAPAALVVGVACALRGVMTAGVVLGDSEAAVSALRPHARVLLVTRDPQDVVALLSAVAG